MSEGMIFTSPGRGEVASDSGRGEGAPAPWRRRPHLVPLLGERVYGAPELSPFPGARRWPSASAVCGLAPRDFWAMTPRELAAAVEGVVGPMPAPLDRTALDALIARYPDTETPTPVSTLTPRSTTLPFAREGDGSKSAIERQDKPMTTEIDTLTISVTADTRAFETRCGR